ncbi:hypothetical protein JHK86_053274 [Glycine max]|nr:hypothetical protein JHK86_053274 [Glycine max]
MAGPSVCNAWGHISGQTLRNAFRWKDRVGPWEQRPGHFGDVWSYWTDEGFGYFEGLQLAEDIGARPLWVFNNGTFTFVAICHEALDGIEFARDEATSRWGSLRASMGHPKPFDLKNVAIGNEDCGKTNYQGMLSPFVSEYAPIGDIQAKHGTLLGAVSEAGFLIGLERNRWNRDAIVFNSNHVYGTPSYWVQFMFRESNGATFLKSQLQTPESDSVPASAILWINPQDKKTYLKIKIVPKRNPLQSARHTSSSFIDTI